MEQKLPKVFVNKIEKEINNNEKTHKTITKEESDILENKNFTYKKQSNKEKTITQKINEIMNSKKYIYKIPVKILINNEERTIQIIGKNKQNLITINNELIDINQIEDIKIDE